MSKNLQIMTDKYLESVEDLAKEESEVVFFNSNYQHASIVMGTIFKFSKDNIKIFAGNLQYDFCQSDRYITELEKFIKRGNKIQILLDELDGDRLPESKISKILLRYMLAFPEKMEIKKSIYSVVDSVTEQKIHFTTSDDKIYRIENDTVNFTAKCCFNDEKQAKSLNEVFDDIFQNNEKSVSIAF